tara:strand:- start:625 stop:921 length:297 start_codon:yes stop_codon:yes gene_type:complete
MPKFIIDQALSLRTIVEVEADSYDDFVKKYKDEHYQDQISHAQMEWNVEDKDEELFDGGWDDYQGTILHQTEALVKRDLCLDRWTEEYKREYLKRKIK